MRPVVIIACFLAGGVFLWLYLSWYLTPVSLAPGTAFRDCSEPGRHRKPYSPRPSAARGDCPWHLLLKI
jgi:hypothetical protein